VQLKKKTFLIKIYFVSFAAERSFVFVFLSPLLLNPEIEFNNWDLPVWGAGIEAEIEGGGGAGGGGPPEGGGGGGGTPPEGAGGGGGIE